MSKIRDVTSTKTKVYQEKDGTQIEITEINVKGSSKLQTAIKITYKDNPPIIFPSQSEAAVYYTARKLKISENNIRKVLNEHNSISNKINRAARGKTKIKDTIVERLLPSPDAKRIK